LYYTVSTFGFVNSVSYFLTRNNAHTAYVTAPATSTDPHFSTCTNVEQDARYHLSIASSVYLFKYFHASICSQSAMVGPSIVAGGEPLASPRIFSHRSTSRRRPYSSLPHTLRHAIQITRTENVDRMVSILVFDVQAR
jgi:hypothetical protein